MEIRSPHRERWARFIGWIGLLGVGLSVLGCVSAARADPVMIWAKGPVKWLILPAEWRLLKQVKGSVQLAVFVEDFWRRRDPDPLTGSNAALEEFQRRTRVANRLFGNETLSGGLTAQGRVLILLGEPTGMKKSHRKVLSLGGEQNSNAPNRQPTRLEPIEIWTYPIQDLHPNLQKRLIDKGLAEIQITFSVESRGKGQVIDGEKWLKNTAKYSVRLPRRVTQ